MPPVPPPARSRLAGAPGLRPAPPYPVPRALAAALAAALVALVLAACGDDAPPPRPSAPGGGERPGAWAGAGLLAEARGGHTATLLGNGKVLVTGGLLAGDDTDVKTAELFDPAADGWSATGAMAHTRAGHTATRLADGKVLVAGGLRQATAEVYDPATATWAGVPDMSTVRAGHTATLLPDGKVLVAGGFSSVDTPALATTEVFDPGARTWAAGPPMAAGRGLHTATALADGKVLVVAGNGSSSQRRVSTDTTTTAPTGGRSGGGGEVNAAEVFDPSTGGWAAVAPLRDARSAHAAALLPDGRVLVSGGFSPSGELESAEVYDPASGQWAPTAPMASPRTLHTATVLADGKVLLVGGRSGATGTLLSSTLPTAALYDPGAGTWRPSEDMSSPRFSHTATLLGDGRVLVAGGLTPAGAVTSTEVFSLQE